MEVKNSEDIRSYVRSRMEQNLRTSVANMRRAGLSRQRINAFYREQMTVIAQECERAVVEYERLKANPDAVSLTTN